MNKNLKTLEKHNVEIGNLVDIITNNGRFTVKVISITESGNVYGRDMTQEFWFEGMFVIYNNS